MKAGTIIKTKLGMAVVINASMYGTSAMRCLLVHKSKSMHRVIDEVEILDGQYVGSWGAIVILPEFVESVHVQIDEQDLIKLTWLRRIRDDGYHYEVWGPHPLCKFRSDQELSWNPIHIASIFSSLGQMESA